MLQYKGLSKPSSLKELGEEITNEFRDIFDSECPGHVDWRQKGLVNPIKDQGQCGSCWTFSSICTLEGQYFKKTGRLVSFSEQQLVDCDTGINEGCNGGWPFCALQFIKENHGINTERAYPYKAVDGRCKAGKGKLPLIKRVIRVAPDEKILKRAVAKIGCIAVAIDASSPHFNSYHNGIYHEPNCSSTNLDHAVTVVGYGTENGLDYWLVRNSWGVDWGMKGYIKMARNMDNNCGVCTEAMYVEL